MEINVVFIFWYFASFLLLLCGNATPRQSSSARRFLSLFLPRTRVR